MSNARAEQLITFTRRLGEALPIEYRDLAATALNQIRTFQFLGCIGDGWSLDTQHFGKQVLGDQQYVIVAAVPHHEQPARQPFLEAVRSVARDRYHDLLQKRLDVSVREISEGRHRLHRLRERDARHLCRASRDLDQELSRGSLGTEDGLHTREALSPDRCHLNDAAIRINCQGRDDTAIREVDMIERTISVYQDLFTLAWNVFELRHNLHEIAGRQSEQKPIAGPG